MSADGDTFYTVQQGIDWGVPEHGAGESGDVERELLAAGPLGAIWKKPLIFPLFPAYSCPYRGLYFHRDRH